jgi:single-stranded DNA-binding protein
VLGQLLDHRPGQGHDAPAGAGLGRPHVQVAPDLDHDFGHIHGARMTEASASLAGNLTDDPEVRYSESGITRAMFRVAVSGRREQEPRSSP